MTAASRARRRRRPEDLEIVAFERGPYTSYSACGIPYFVGDLVSDIDELVARTPDEHRRNGIDVRTGHEVVAVDNDRRRVRVRDLYDGAPERAVIVGGGYIGLEMAEALVRRGLEVSLIDRTEQPMGMALDADMGALVGRALGAVGVTLHMGERVEGFDADDRRVRAVRTPRRTLPADLVVLGTGVRPDSRLAGESGIAIGETGGIVTDARMQTSVDGVWAAGDCVETVDCVTGNRVLIPLGTHANKQGRVVGINATGGDVRFPGVIGTAASKICAYEVARSGLTEGQAAQAGIGVVAATIQATTRAGYYPG